MQQYFLLQGEGLQLPKGDKEVAAENNSSGIFLLPSFRDSCE